jgi:hypothetical protein
VWTAHALAQEIVDGVLHPQRAARLVALHAQDAARPSLDDVLSMLVDATWGPASGVRVPAEDAVLRRVAQRAALDGLLDLAGSPDATAEVRAVTEHHLAALHARLAASPGGSAEERGHRAAARRDVERYLAGQDDRARRPRPDPIPLPWP